MFPTENLHAFISQPTKAYSISSSFLGPNLPDGFWGQTSFLSNGYRGLLPRLQSGRGVMLMTHLHLAPRTRTRAAISPLHHTSSWSG